MDIFKEAANNPKTAAQFIEGDRYMRCKGHAITSMANQELREINLQECAQLYSFMTRIDFQNNQLEKVPDDFFQCLTSLEVLNLSKNKITSLPAGMGDLQDLAEIDVSVNQLSVIPADISKLKDSLVYLDISHNPLHTLPEAVFSCVKLEDLIAENIGVLGDISNLKNLKELKNLNLGYNCIEKISDELGDLPLTQLNLSGVPWVPMTSYPSLVMFSKAISENMVTRKLGPEVKLFCTIDKMLLILKLCMYFIIKSHFNLSEMQALRF